MPYSFICLAGQLSALMSAAAAALHPAREAVRAARALQSRYARFCELMTRKLPNVTPALCAAGPNCSPARPARCKATTC